MLTWFGSVLVIYWMANAGLTILLIGKPRERITPGVAFWSGIFYALLIWGTVVVGTTH